MIAISGNAGSLRDILPEMHASMVAVTAVAFAIEAFHGDVAPLVGRDPDARSRRTRRSRSRGRRSQARLGGRPRRNRADARLGGRTMQLPRRRRCLACHGDRPPPAWPLREARGDHRDRGDRDRCSRGPGGATRRTPSKRALGRGIIFVWPVSTPGRRDVSLRQPSKPLAHCRRTAPRYRR
jgi:hypothetical protein